MAEFRAVFRNRLSGRRWAACVLAVAFALTLGAGTTEAQTPVKLVSNTGQDTDGTSAVRFDRAQTFETGSNAAGYTLTSVKFFMSGTFSHHWELRIESLGSNNKPGGSLGALSCPIADIVDFVYTCTTDGIDLSAGTTYFVVLQGPVANLDINYRRTESDNEDGGAAAGWSIGNGSLWDDDTTLDWDRTSTTSWKIEIHGYEKVSPTLQAATVSGDRLSLTFSQALDGSSVPAAAAFAVAVDGGAPAAPAAVGISGRTVTLTLAEAVEPGAAVTVSYDPARAGGNPLRSAGGVEVAAFTGRPVRNGEPEAQRRVLERTLAAVASRTVAGALNNIGTRLGDAAPTPGMTIAGETVRFGASGTAGATERWAAACPPDAFRDCMPHPRSRGGDADALMRATAFSWTLGAAPGDKEGGTGFDPDAPRWAVWGRGDFGSFEGRPDGISSYSGETRTGWLGVDAREAPRNSGRPGRWVAGLAVSRGMSETDYTLENEAGRIETDLTALWPYGRWTFENGLELRGMLGAGRGEARHMPGDGEPMEKSDLTMWTGSAGLRRPLPPLAGIGLAARGDVSLARMRTAKGEGDEEQAVDGLSADAWRVRGGIEASRRIPFDDGSTLTPFVETAARRDGGDGVTGTGLEVAGGVRVAAERLQIEARGRWLAAHTEKGAEERGVSLTARLGPGAQGRGLSVSLAPRWGAPAGGAGKLWHEELPRGAASGTREVGALDGELGYGFALFGGRLTGTPNAGFGASDGGGRDYRIGWRLTPAVPGYAGFRVDLDATRRESANANEPPAHGAMLTGAMRW